MRVGVWLFLGAVVSAILTASCGSIVRSKPEVGPPPDHTNMEGLVYWLPKGAIVIEGTWDKDNADWKFTITPHIEADTSQRWRLSRKVNYLFQDTVTLEVDAKTGLLKTVSGTSENKTVDIIAEGLAVASQSDDLWCGWRARSKAIVTCPNANAMRRRNPVCSFHRLISVHDRSSTEE